MRASTFCQILDFYLTLKLLGGGFWTCSKMVTSFPFRDEVTLIHASQRNVNITENYSLAFNKEFCSQMLEMLVLLEMML